MRQQNIIAILLVLGLMVLGAFVLLGSGPEETPSSIREEDIPGPLEVADLPEEIMREQRNIVEIASANPQFSTLVSAVRAAGLVETLSGEGPFTVFAPTNEAFSKLPDETLEAVMNDEEQLTSILTYHVVLGKVLSEDVVDLDSATTVQGGELDIQVNGNSVMLNNASILDTDIEASNGVIHVIDTVLIPQ